MASDHLGDQGGAIDLTWNASIDNVGVTSYRLYRGTSPGVYGAPITLFSLTNYTDNTVVSGTHYYYAVSAVDAAGNASALSAESSAIAVDDLPPAVPTGLAAVGGTGQVALTWTANGESDLAGYDLYRNGTKVNATPLTGTSFTDTGRAAGTMYSYRLASVDTHGNASAQCSPVTATTSGTAGGLVDGGFENGSDGAALGLPWYIGGTPQHAEYDSARAKNGSLSGWIQGPTAATYASFGETTTANMTTNGAEQRFWVYFDSTNQFRAMDNWITAAADRPFYIQFANDGNIYVYTDRPGNPNGYTTAGHTRVGTLRDRLDRGPRHQHVLGRRPAVLHALGAAKRHGSVDAAQGEPRDRVQHPVQRHQQHHEDRRPAVRRLPEREHVDRRPALLADLPVLRRSHGRSRRVDLAVRYTDLPVWHRLRSVHHHTGFGQGRRRREGRRRLGRRGHELRVHRPSHRPHHRRDVQVTSGARHADHPHRLRRVPCRRRPWLRARLRRLPLDLGWPPGHSLRHAHPGRRDRLYAVPRRVAHDRAQRAHAGCGWHVRCATPATPAPTRSWPTP